MSRPRTGTLVWRKRGWGARVTIYRDGVRSQTVVDLGTSSRSLAERKLLELNSNTLTSTELRALARKRETFLEAAERLVGIQRDEGLKTWTERLYRIRQFAAPLIGNLDPREVKPSHVQEVFRSMVKLELSRQTIKHMKADLSRVFADLIREELCEDNPVSKTVVPANASVDTRERIVLTDEEFAAFMSCREVSPELHTMAMASRCLGGMRTSDLHAWDWSHIDTDNWADAHVPRPKVAKSARRLPRLVLPEILVPVLVAWWDAQGRPVSGPVFPVQKGPRAGKTKGRGISYAQALRDALWAAGVVRPLPGFDRARTEEERKVRCLIQSGDNLEYKPVDFHSFRRAFATSLASANVSTPMAMALADHHDPATHARYVRLGQRTALEMPSLALPQGLSRTVLNRETPNSVSDRNYTRARKDSNLRPTAPEIVEVAPESLFEPEDLQGNTHENGENQSSAQSSLLNDPVERALANALNQATQAQQWDTVAELARELQARRQALSNVVSLDSVRAGKGRAK
jgi:integrase